MCGSTHQLDRTVMVADIAYEHTNNDEVMEATSELQSMAMGSVCGKRLQAVASMLRMVHQKRQSFRSQSLADQSTAFFLKQAHEDFVEQWKTCMKRMHASDETQEEIRQKQAAFQQLA